MEVSNWDDMSKTKQASEKTLRKKNYRSGEKEIGNKTNPKGTVLEGNQN